MWDPSSSRPKGEAGTWRWGQELRGTPGTRFGIEHWGHRCGGHCCVPPPTFKLEKIPFSPQITPRSIPFCPVGHACNGVTPPEAPSLPIPEGISAGNHAHFQKSPFFPLKPCHFPAEGGEPSPQGGGQQGPCAASVDPSDGRQSH